MPTQFLGDYVRSTNPILSTRKYVDRIGPDGKPYKVLQSEEPAYIHKSVQPYLEMFMAANDPGKVIMRAATNLNFFMKRLAVGGSFFCSFTCRKSDICIFNAARQKLC